MQSFFFSETAIEAHEIATSFEAEGRIPGVIGLIDATHICIRTPEYEPDVYIMFR